MTFDAEPNLFSIADDPADDFAEVVQAEQSLLTDEVRSDPARLRVLLHPDFVEYAASGRIYETRARLMAQIGPLPRRVTFEVMGQTRLSADTVTPAVEGVSSASTSLRSSIWVRDDACRASAMAAVVRPGGRCRPRHTGYSGTRAQIALKVSKPAHTIRARVGRTECHGAHSYPVPVPALETPVVRPHVLASRPGVKLPDDDVVCAHIFLLGPFVDKTDVTAGLVTIRQVFNDVHRFEFELTDFRGFADGLVYLAPEPAEPFKQLTERLVEAFPAWQPYGGQFDEVIPHLSLGTSLPAYEIMALLRKLPWRRWPTG